MQILNFDQIYLNFCKKHLCVVLQKRYSLKEHKKSEFQNITNKDFGSTLDDGL